MQDVNVTELRQHLPKYLAYVMNGQELLVTSHSKIIARIIPVTDARQEAQKKIQHLRKICVIHDVVSPIDEAWNAA